MFDAATDPVAAVQPEPPRAVPPRIGQVLGLVRTLIAYGKNLADTLRQHAADPHVLPCFAFITSVFATTDLALILARIARGLLRAAALEARLSKRAARGRDLKPTPIRLPSPRKPRATKPATPPSGPAEDPSPEEIVAKDRRRPIGAVLVDICLDLGIVPGQMDHATWDELRRDLILYGGSLTTLLFKREGKRRSADPFAFPPYGSDPRLVGRKSDAHSATEDSPIPSPSFSPIPIAGQPIIAFPAWPAPSPTPACTGPP